MSELGAAPDLDLHGLLLIFRRRFRILVFVPIAVTAAALASAAATTPKYRSSAEILIGQTQAEALFTPSAASYSDPDRMLANQIRVLHSQQVSDLATKRLGYAAGIAATASTTEDIITVTAVQTSRTRAAAVVNAYATAYVDYRRSTGAEQNTTAQTEVRRQISDTEARLAGPVSPTERAALLAQSATLRSQLAQLEAAANVDRGGAELLGAASVPAKPFEPRPIRSGAAGLAVGLLLGLGLALLRDQLDKRIRTREDLELVSGQLPVVGLVPRVPGARRSASSRTIASLEDPASGAAEAYRSLRTSIEFLGVDRSLKTLQITSATMGEGKTTTLVNLAVALARAGRRVVVVDCDLRRPTVHEYFGLQADVGFTSVLKGDVALPAALQQVPGVDGLLVLRSGPVPPNPSELLSGRHTKEILAALQADADIVLVDSPPVLPVSDAAALATRVDGVLVVASANSSQRHDVARALERLRQVDAVVVGTVLNRVGVGPGGYGSYRYGSYDGNGTDPDSGSEGPKGLQRFRPTVRSR